MLFGTLQEATRALINDAYQNARSKYRTAVRPIYGLSDKGTPDHIGSSVLIEIDSRKVLLTAAHIIDENAHTTLYLGGDQMIAIQATAFISSAPNGNRNDDHFDFAFFELDQTTQSNLSKATYISESDISRIRTYTDQRAFLCLGYPNSKNHINPTSTKVRPMLAAYTAQGLPASHLPDLASDVAHILVARDKRRGRNDNGEIVNLSAFRGCSGGAIFDLGPMSLAAFGTLPPPQLAAIVIEAHSHQKVILSTRLSLILPEIRKRISENQVVQKP